MLRLSIGGTYKEVIVTDRAGFEVLRMMEIAHGRAASGAEYKVLKMAVGIFRLSLLGLFKRFMRFFPCLPIHNRFMGIFKNHLLFYRILNLFGFVRRRTCLEIDRHAQILALVQNTDDRPSVPVIVACFLPSGVISVPHIRSAEICTRRNPPLCL